MPHQLCVHAHYKSKASLNQFVRTVNHIKMGLNWPNLGPRRIGSLPSLQTNGEVPAQTNGTTILLLTIMNFVESIRGRTHLYHEICVKIKNPQFCGNQVTPVWRVTNQLWRVLGEFYASIYSHLTSLIASRRCRQAMMSVAFAGSSNLMPVPWKKSVHLKSTKWSQQLPSAVATAVYCWRMLSLSVYVNVTANDSAYLAHFHFLNRDANLVISTNG